MDGEMPSAFLQRNRKAIKKHRCCECCGDINKGDVYEYSSGVWDGQPDSFKTCLSCVTLRRDYKEKTGDDACFGELKECISNAFYKNYGPVQFIADYPENEKEFKNLFRSEFIKLGEE